MDLAWWIGVIGVPLVSALFAADFYIHRNAQTERDRAVAEKNREIAELHNRISAVNKEFYDYKVGSAQLFATVAAVGEVKRELMNSLGRIEDKLDRIVERNDRHDRRP
jgi:hypothetical protein